MDGLTLGPPGFALRTLDVRELGNAAPAVGLVGRIFPGIKGGSGLVRDAELRIDARAEDELLLEWNASKKTPRCARPRCRATVR